MKNILYILVLSISLVGCKHDSYQPDEDKSSGVRLSISINGAMNDLTKAFINDDFELQLSHLKGEIKKGDNVIAKWDDMSKAPDVIFLDPAVYTIEMQTKGVRNAINTVPMYVSSQEFEVESGKMKALQVGCTIESSAVTVVLTGDLTNITDYKLCFYHMNDHLKDLYIVTQAQNNPKPMKLYMDKPFPFGVRIEGKLNGRDWKKHVIVYEVAHKNYYNLTLN